MPEPINQGELARRLTKRVGIARPRRGPRNHHKYEAMLRQVQEASPQGVRWLAEELPYSKRSDGPMKANSAYYALRRTAKTMDVEIHVAHGGEDLPEGALEVWLLDDWKAAREAAKQLVREKADDE